jgi:DNA repair ATPase RecN
MGLLMGGRSSVEQVRTGERMTIIEGIFESNHPPKAASIKF